MKSIISDYGSVILRIVWFLIAIHVLWAVYEWIIPYMQTLDSAF